jgi:hypothetical protein
MRGRNTLRGERVPPVTARPKNNPKVKDVRNKRLLLEVKNY